VKALKNAVHWLLLGCWAVLGAVFTLHCLSSSVGVAAGLLHASDFWLWLVGFAALTSVVVARFSRPLAAVAVHVGTLLLLALLPHVFPLSLFRVGLDVLLHA